MHVLVAGGAGFIGSNLVRRLANQYDKVTVVDNLTRGSESFLPTSSRIQFYDTDIALEDFKDLINKISSDTPIDTVWHLAANSDIPAGVANLAIDYKDTFRTTMMLCDAFTDKNIKSIYFASSSAIYGDFGDEPIGEDTGPCLPISNYGAMKLASEALLSSWVEGKTTDLCIFRFPNVVGAPSTHGILYDFITKLHQNPKVLEVLGDGSQKKPYLLCEQLIDIMITLSNSKIGKRAVFNIGPKDDGVTVREIAEHVVSYFSGCTDIKYQDSCVGWLGDIPRFNYRIDKMNLVYQDKILSSKEAISIATEQIYNQFLFP